MKKVCTDQSTDRHTLAGYLKYIALWQNNSKKLFLADKAGDWQRLGLWAGRLMFTTENARECVQVLERYLGRGSYQPNDYTRGLYYRGVE